MFGHRGFTHSILFALIVAAAGWGLAQRLQATRWVVCLVLFLSTVSHGVLDAMTTGGLGVAFFSPFSNQRIFLPWRVIEVSPMGVSRFFSVRGIQILASEVVTVWLPCLLFAVVGILVRKQSTRRAEQQSQENSE
jgi:inner membrane protein